MQREHQSPPIQHLVAATSQKVELYYYILNVLTTADEQMLVCAHPMAQFLHYSLLLFDSIDHIIDLWRPCRHCCRCCCIVVLS